MIRLEGVSKSFGNNQVLRGVNLSVQPGETLTVIGGSGTGKSVLLKIIVGLMKPDGGNVWVDEVNLTGLEESQLTQVQRKFGFLFQGAALFDSLTVGDNVLFGVRNLRPDLLAQEEELVRNSLAMVGLKPEVARLKPAELSGGMKKRVGLARAIAHEPAYIFYDEPTTGLDPLMSDTINDLILAVQEKLHVTSIVVTHDMKSAYKVSDRIAMLQEGVVLTTGTPQEIQANPDILVQRFITGNASLTAASGAGR